MSNAYALGAAWLAKENEKNECVVRAEPLNDVSKFECRILC